MPGVAAADLAAMRRALEHYRKGQISEGDAAAAEALALWLRQGPPMARVGKVERSDCEGDGISGFVIG